MLHVSFAISNLTFSYLCYANYMLYLAFIISIVRSLFLIVRLNFRIAMYVNLE